MARDAIVGYSCEQQWRSLPSMKATIGTARPLVTQSMEVTFVDLGAVQCQPRRPKIQQHMTGLHGLDVIFLKIQTSVLSLPALSNCSSWVLQGLRIVRQAIQTFIRLTSFHAGYITRCSTSARWIPSRLLLVCLECAKIVLVSLRFFIDTCHELVAHLTVSWICFRFRSFVRSCDRRIQISRSSI